MYRSAEHAAQARADAAAARRDAAHLRHQRVRDRAHERARGAALARELVLARRLAAIASLVRAARAARNLPSVDPIEWLRRPARGEGDACRPEAIHARCDDVEEKLSWLDLGGATGRPEDRAHEAARLRAFVAAARTMRPRLAALEHALERYEAAVIALFAPEAIAADAKRELGELPVIELDDDEALLASFARLETETRRLEDVARQLGARVRATSAPSFDPHEPHERHQSARGLAFRVALAVLAVLLGVLLVVRGHATVAVLTGVLVLRLHRTLWRTERDTMARARRSRALR